MTKSREPGARKPFEIPYDLILAEAPKTLKSLRNTLSKLKDGETIVVEVSGNHPTQVGLELLHSAALSAEAGAPLEFGERAQTILSKAIINPDAIAVPDGMHP